MRLIELHCIDNEPLLLNVNNIITINKEGKSTRICTSNGVLYVKETPDEIKIKICG